MHEVLLRSGTTRLTSELRCQRYFDMRSSVPELAKVMWSLSPGRFCNRSRAASPYIRSERAAPHQNASCTRCCPGEARGTVHEGCAVNDISTCGPPCLSWQRYCRP